MFHIEKLKKHAIKNVRLYIHKLFFSFFKKYKHKNGFHLGYVGSPSFQVDLAGCPSFTKSITGMSFAYFKLGPTPEWTLQAKPGLKLMVVTTRYYNVHMRKLVE